VQISFVICEKLLPKQKMAQIWKTAVSEQKKFYGNWRGLASTHIQHTPSGFSQSPKHWAGMIKHKYSFEVKGITQDGT
jgi:hypothetical protein